jgi:hypothetical protein
MAQAIMIALYSYPGLFGVADNNGYGLKVFAFLKLTGLPFTHQHIFDASAAPRGQLPYIVDDGETIGDSDTIIEHLTRKYRLTIDDGLTAAQRDTSHGHAHARRPVLGHVLFALEGRAVLASLLRCVAPGASEPDGSRAAKGARVQRSALPLPGYRPLRPARRLCARARGFAGVGEPHPMDAYLHGPTPTSIDAGIYGFIANIYFYAINTPLKAFVAAHPNLVRHCTAIHAAVGATSPP